MGIQFNIKNYDYYLILATSAALFAIGIVCVFGVWYSYGAFTSNPDWQGTAQYPTYISLMNMYVYPFMLALLLALGLCIPKRIVPRSSLINATSGILALTLVISIADSIEAGVAFILVMSIAVQAVVLVLTLAKSGALTFDREGHMIRVGSSLLHLGTVLFIFDFASMRESAYHIPVFWVVTLLLTVGLLLSFYPSAISRVLHTTK